MSRIGKLPVVLPEKVDANIENNTIKVKWPLWELSFTFTNAVTVLKEEDSIIVLPVENNPDSKTLWGTTRSVINNMVEWVSNGYKKSLEINWVWYKFEVQWNKIMLSVWFSHKVELEVPEWLKAMMDEKEKNILHINWVDKQFVWQFASKIKSIKRPEPYKGKWIKYLGEQIIRKAWKSGK